MLLRRGVSVAFQTVDMERVTKMWAMWIIEESLSFSTFAKSTFTRCVSYLCSAVDTLSRQDLRTYIMKSWLGKRAVIKTTLKNVTAKISFTTDIWTHTRTRLTCASQLISDTRIRNITGMSLISWRCRGLTLKAHCAEVSANVEGV